MSMHNFIENSSCTLDNLIVMILNIRYFLGIYQIEKLWYFCLSSKEKKSSVLTFLLISSRYNINHSYLLRI